MVHPLAHTAHCARHTPHRTTYRPQNMRAESRLQTILEVQTTPFMTRQYVNYMCHNTHSMNGINFNNILYDQRGEDQPQNKCRGLSCNCGG